MSKEEASSSGESPPLITTNESRDVALPPVPVAQPPAPVAQTIEVEEEPVKPSWPHGLSLANERDRKEFDRLPDDPKED